MTAKKFKLLRLVKRGKLMGLMLINRNRIRMIKSKKRVARKDNNSRKVKSNFKKKRKHIKRLWKV